MSEHSQYIDFSVNDRTLFVSLLCCCLVLLHRLHFTISCNIKPVILKRKAHCSENKHAGVLFQWQRSSGSDPVPYLVQNTQFPLITTQKLHEQAGRSCNCLHTVYPHVSGVYNADWHKIFAWTRLLQFGLLIDTFRLIEPMGASTSCQELTRANECLSWKEVPASHFQCKDRANWNRLCRWLVLRITNEIRKMATCSWNREIMHI